MALKVRIIQVQSDRTKDVTPYGSIRLEQTGSTGLSWLERSLYARDDPFMGSDGIEKAERSLYTRDDPPMVYDKAVCLGLQSPVGP